MALIHLCFFLSGAAGLVYQVLWTRELGLVIGHTVYAITTVLAAFMAGLALGARVFGRLVDAHGRPLRLYALLEGGVGLACLFLPVLLNLAGRIFVLVYPSLSPSPSLFVLFEFAVLFPLLVVPTTLMGGTLPVLTKLVVTSRQALGARLGDLYSVNTFGAVFGAVAAGFFLLPTIGMRSTNLLAVAVSFGVTALALAADRRVESVEARPEPEAGRDVSASSDVPSKRLIGIALVAVALSGAASMVYEIAWTRVLTLVVGSSTYAFSTMLATFLLGLAVGSFLFARISRRRQAGLGFFGRVEVIVGFATLLLIPVFGTLPRLCLWMFERIQPSFASALAVQFLLSFLVMIVPTILIGATFPAVAAGVVADLVRVGRGVGAVYAANTAGTIAGALGAGFFLVPLLGAQSSILLAAAVNVLVGMAILWALGQRLLPAFLPVAFVVVAVALPRWDPLAMGSGMSIYAPQFLGAGGLARLDLQLAAQQVLFYREGLNATVSVETSPRGTTILKVNGKTDASNGIDMLTQIMLGHLPALLHPRPERVLVIGLGSGVTAGAFAAHPVEEIDVVELEPAVKEAAAYFSRENRGVLDDPRVRLHLADGRTFVQASVKPYDVISSEPSNPWMAGVANLFSREFYEQCRRKLAPGGLMVQWVHGYSLFPTDLQQVVSTFRRVFPHTSVWQTHKGDYLLVGTEERLAVDYEALRRRYEASASVREDMATLGWDSPLALLTLFLLDEDDAARFAAGARENTDDLPLLEFSAPLALYAMTTEENDAVLQRFRSRRLPDLRNVDERLLDAPRTRLRFARSFWARGYRQAALVEMRDLAAAAEEDPELRIERARLLFSLGKAREAIADLGAIGSASEPLVESYLRAGRILEESGMEEVVTEHGRTYSGSPNPAEALNNLGVFYYSLGLRSREEALFDLAIDAFGAALTLESTSYPLLNNVGNAYFEKRMWKEAADVYGKAIAASPGLAQAHFNLGLLHEKQGALGLAEEGYREAIRRDPNWRLPQQNLTRLQAAAQVKSESNALAGH